MPEKHDISILKIEENWTERAILTKIAMIVDLDVWSEMAKEFSIFLQPKKNFLNGDWKKKFFGSSLKCPLQLWYENIIAIIDWID